MQDTRSAMLLRPTISDTTRRLTCHWRNTVIHNSSSCWCMTAHAPHVCRMEMQDMHDGTGWTCISVHAQGLFPRKVNWLWPGKLPGVSSLLRILSLHYYGERNTKRLHNIKKKKREYVNEVAGNGQSRLTSILSARLWENESLATLGNQTCFSLAPGFLVRHSTNGNSRPQSKLWSLITSLCTLWGYPPRWIACWPEGHEGPCVTCQASSMPGSTALCNTYPHTVSLLLLFLSGSSPQSS